MRYKCFYFLLKTCNQFHPLNINRWPPKLEAFCPVLSSYPMRGSIVWHLPHIHAKFRKDGAILATSSVITNWHGQTGGWTHRARSTQPGKIGRSIWRSTSWVCGQYLEVLQTFWPMEYIIFSTHSVVGKPLNICSRKSLVLLRNPRQRKKLEYEKTCLKKSWHLFGNKTNWITLRKFAIYFEKNRDRFFARKPLEN